MPKSDDLEDATLFKPPLRGHSRRETRQFTFIKRMLSEKEKTDAK